MPNVKTQKRIISATPIYTAMKLMAKVNALYQSGFIGTDEKAWMNHLIKLHMGDGDNTDLYGYVTEQCLCADPSNPFYDQMEQILSEEVPR